VEIFVGFTNRRWSVAKDLVRKTINIRSKIRCRAPDDCQSTSLTFYRVSKYVFKRVFTFGDWNAYVFAQHIVFIFYTVCQTYKCYWIATRTDVYIITSVAYNPMSNDLFLNALCPSALDSWAPVLVPYLEKQLVREVLSISVSVLKKKETNDAFSSTFVPGDTIVKRILISDGCTYLIWGYFFPKSELQYICATRNVPAQLHFEVRFVFLQVGFSSPYTGGSQSAASGRDCACDLFRTKSRTIFTRMLFAKTFTAVFNPMTFM
jgi:hypothetical protein